MVTWFKYKKKLIGKFITRYRRIRYNLNVMRQSACLVFNQVIVDNYAAFFNCTPVGRASDSMRAQTYRYMYLFSLVWAGASCLLLGPSGFNWCFSFAPDFSKLFGAQVSPSSGSLLNLWVLVFDSSWWLS